MNEGSRDNPQSGPPTDNSRLEQGQELFAPNLEDSLVLASSPEPFVHRIGNNVVVFGVLHENFVTETGKQFRRVIRHADHLLVEGSREELDARIDQVQGRGTPDRPRNYEEEAIGIFNSRDKLRNIHPLETNILNFFEKYGLDWQRTLIHIIGGAQPQIRAGLPLRDIPRFLDFLQRYHPLLNAKRREISEILERINRSYEISLGRRVLRIQNPRINLLRAGIILADQYLGDMRDHEEIVPNARRLVSQLKGNKVVVVGKGHLANQKIALSGGVLKPLPPWEEFKDSLSPIERQAVDVYEEVAHGIRP